MTDGWTSRWITGGAFTERVHVRFVNLRMDGQTADDGQTDRWMDGQMDTQTTEGWRDRWTGGRRTELAHLEKVTYELTAPI